MKEEDLNVYISQGVDRSIWPADMKRVNDKQRAHFLISTKRELTEQSFEDQMPAKEE